MNVVQAILLGVVQGITEWLPISSSGHLVFLKYLFGLESSVGFDILVHVASLIAVIIVFREDIRSILQALIRWQTNTESFRLAMYLAIATLPIALIGYVFSSTVHSAFESLLVLAIAWIFTGAVLYTTKFTQTKKAQKLTTKKALIIGCAQVLALLPGVSRSGITISTSLLTGISKNDAARFSFLLFIPALLGALIYEITQGAVPYDAISVVGFLVSLAVSLVVLKFLLVIIKKGFFHHFAWYCWLMGIIALFLYLI